MKSARELREALVRTLSPRLRCDGCCRRRPIIELEIDHVDGRDWVGRALSQLQRANRYWSEYLLGVRLRVLCRSCNAIDGNHRRWSAARSAVAA